MKYQVISKDEVIAEFNTLRNAHLFAETYSYITNGNSIYGFFGIAIHEKE